MCFESNKTGQREGLSKELIFELRWRYKRKAVTGRQLLGRGRPGGAPRWPEAGMNRLSSETERRCVTGLRTSGVERRLRVPSLSDSSMIFRVGDLHNSRGCCPNFQPACNQHLPLLTSTCTPAQQLRGQTQSVYLQIFFDST